MPLISMRQLLDHAAEHSYGVPAFNVNNMEQIKAIMQAAHKTENNSSGLSWRAQVRGRAVSAPPRRRGRGGLSRASDSDASGPRCFARRLHGRDPLRASPR